MTSTKESSHRLAGSEPQSIAALLAPVLIGLVLLVPAARAADGDIVRAAGNVSYVSGGVGTESLDQLTALARDFNLKLVFALKSGEFVSGVKVAIVNAAGKPLLDATSDGPWLLARLPAGSYRVDANFSGNTITRNISVGAEKLNTLDFRWAAE